MRLRLPVAHNLPVLLHTYTDLKHVLSHCSIVLPPPLPVCWTGDSGEAGTPLKTFSSVG